MALALWLSDYDKSSIPGKGEKKFVSWLYSSSLDIADDLRWKQQQIELLIHMGIFEKRWNRNENFKIMFYCNL